MRRPNTKWPGLLPAVLGAVRLCLCASRAAGAAAASIGGEPPEKADGAQVIQLPVTVSRAAGFAFLAPASLGIAVRGARADGGGASLRLIANRGVALGDADGDGWCDVFLCLEGRASGLWRNLGGWRFEDVTQESGLALAARDLYGATFADVNGDGALDLVALSLSQPRGNALFLNDGRGRFTERRDFPWLHNPTGGSTTAALADIDGDGDLDMFVANYRQRILADIVPRAELRRGIEEEVARLRAGRPVSADFAAAFEAHRIWQGGPTEYFVEEVGVPNALYLNQGSGRFELVRDAAKWFSDEEGRPMGLPSDWSLCASFHDVTGDGAPDLYVCNDFFSRDQLWLNDGRGHFRLAPHVSLRHLTAASMGADFADVNGDGQVDFVTLDMLKRDHVARIVQAGTGRPTPLVWGDPFDRPQYVTTCLFANRGDGTFGEVGRFAGIAATDWAWSAMFLDADLDGYEDLLVTTGVNRDPMDADVARRIEAMGDLPREARVRAEQMYPPGLTRNLVFRNLGGFRFEEVGQQWGFTNAAASGGMARGDLDNDGDLDVVICNSGSPPEIYRNEAGAPRVAVRLRGRAPNTQAVGARVALFGGAVPVQTQEIVCGGLYTSGSDPLRVFASGRNPQGMRLEVRWRDGSATVVENVKANCLYIIDEVKTPRPSR